MFTVIGLMLGGMAIGFLLRRQEFSWINKVITSLIWVLLFLLGVEVGGNRQIVEGLATLGVEAFTITLAKSRTDNNTIHFFQAFFYILICQLFAIDKVNISFAVVISCSL